MLRKSLFSILLLSLLASSQLGFSASANAAPEEPIEWTLTVTATDIETGQVIGTSETSTVGTDGDLSLVTTAAACSPGAVSLTARIKATQFGITVYRFWHNIDFYWNCTNVTKLPNHAAYFTDFNNGWSQQGSVTRQKTGVGTPHATAVAQGHAGQYCYQWYGGCAADKYPTIKWDFTGRGGRSVTWSN